LVPLLPALPFTGCGADCELLCLRLRDELRLPLRGAGASAGAGAGAGRRSRCWCLSAVADRVALVGCKLRVCARREYAALVLGVSWCVCPAAFLLGTLPASSVCVCMLPRGWIPSKKRSTASSHFLDQPRKCMTSLSPSTDSTLASYQLCCLSRASIRLPRFSSRRQPSVASMGGGLTRGLDRLVGAVARVAV
jgi:hypothetical protein